MMKSIITALLVAAALTATAQAELLKTFEISCKKNEICFHVRPKLPPISGWHNEAEVDSHYDITSRIPDGVTFGKAKAIIYAKAIYIPRYQADNPATKDLDGFIADDIATFRKNNPGIEIAEVPRQITSDGVKLRTFTFFRRKDHNFEQTAYYQEDDFYITFVINAKSEADLTTNLPIFTAMLKAYRK